MKLIVDISGVRPVSKKNSKQLFINRRTGKRFITASGAYKRYRTEMLWRLRKFKQRFRGEVVARYLYELKGKLDIDLDNANAGVNDILETAGIIDNDKNIMEQTAVKTRGHKDWRIRVEIMGREVDQHGKEHD